MLPYAAHLKNKYPGGRVVVSEEAIDAYCAGGEHRVALRKNGAGQWVDQSERLGCVDSFDLAPIPKDCRVHKAFSDKLGLDDKADERKEKRKALVRSGKVLSIAEYQKEGLQFDEAGNHKA